MGIICLQASSNYTKLYLKGIRKLIMAAITLKYFQALLPAGNFVRVHSSYLININHVQATHIPKTIFLSQNIEVPVLKRRSHICALLKPTYNALA